MKIRNRQKIKLSKKTVIFLMVCFFVISCLTWFLIKFFSIKSDLEIVNSFTFPEITNLQERFENEEGIFSISIDGNIISGKNSEEIRPTASTAKMILGLVVMKKKPFNLGETGETITITQEFYDKYIYYLYHNGSNTAVSINEEISQYDALMSVFLASSNNMADTLAIWAFGSLDEYREYAANYLRELNINNTSIGTDASGFSETTTSTANDLAKIGNLVLSNPVLAEIVGTKSYDIPVAGRINNTNRLLGNNGIAGIKTGYIGDNSGYCLVTGYKEKEHNITISLLGATTREKSFNDSLALVKKTQETVRPLKLIREGQIIGYYESWWAGKIPIYADEDLDEIIYSGVEMSSKIEMDGEIGKIAISIGEYTYDIGLSAPEYDPEPTFVEKVKRVFGWKNDNDKLQFDSSSDNDSAEINSHTEENESKNFDASDQKISFVDESFTNATSNNCTIKYGKLMLVNPNFIVDDNFISTRKRELISISSRYGIPEYNIYNGDNLLDAEAAEHLNDLVKAYESEHPGHALGTLSCFRAVSPGCGRMCAATGTSDHHTGLTCDLIDSAYGTGLGTDNNYLHPEWTWLHENSYKYGFIDRFPPEWAGGSMDEPLNVDENGTTGLYETWHYRYVGIPAATEIATGVHNNGTYDSLEHYLKMKGLVSDLKNGQCE